VVSLRVRRVGLLLLATLAVGASAVLSRPAGVPTSEMWPVGLAVAAVMRMGLRRSGPVLAAIVVISILTFQVGDRQLEYSVFAGLAIAAETFFMAAVFTDRGRREASLIDDGDLHRFLLGAVGGCFLGAVGFAVGAAVSLDSSPLLVFNGTFCGHLSSVLVLLPFFMRTQRHPAPAGMLERVLQWVMVILVTTIAFGRDAPPAMLFTIVPVIGWGALRARLVDVQLQLLALATIGTLLTSFGHGPLAESPGMYDLPGLVSGAALQIFFITNAAVAIPLSMAVGQQARLLREAQHERDLANRVVQSAHVAIIGTDELGRINLFNPGAVRLLGWQPQQIMGEYTTVFHTDQEISRMAALLEVDDTFVDVAVALAREEHGPEEMWFRHADGSERLLLLTLKAVLASGGVVGYVGTAEDVTDQANTHRALVEALEKERAAVSQLKEVDRVKDAFVSSVSHELRTPITSISGYLEMLSEGDFGSLNDAQQNAVERVGTNSRRLLTLIDELLTLSRMQSPEVEPVRQRLDFRDVVQQAVDVVRPAAESRHQELELGLPEDGAPIDGDVEMLERLVVNLVSNAVKFTPERGHVQVRVELDDAVVELVVRDDGIGIPAEEQSRLFTRFFRASTAQVNAVPGTGLGLAIAHRVVEVHDGTIAIHSEQGEGTTVVVRLPLSVQAVG
jgi:PAS domain S-box-containing protein